MIRSHSSATDPGDLLIENTNCGRRIAEFGQRRDLAVPAPLDAAEPHREVFDPTPVRREGKKTNPGPFLPYGRARNRTRRRRSETLWMNRGTLPSYTFKKNECIASRNGENLSIICGKTQVSKITR